MESKRNRLIAVLFMTAGLGALGVGYGALVRHGIGVPCLFYTICGLRCPGCGISRGLAALLVGRFADSMQYNLLAPWIMLYILWVCFFTAKRYVNVAKWQYVSPCKWVDMLTLVLVVAWWILRNVIGI